MRGRRVERRFGWDCHGLPAEVQAEKELGISGHPEIGAFGVDKFNDACRSSVLQFTEEWRDYVTRQARWVDFDNDYKTLDLDYMESVMWAFKTLWDKGLIYEGSGFLRTAGDARLRCRTRRPAWTTFTEIVKTPGDRLVRAGNRGAHPCVDDDAVDTSIKPRPRSRPRYRLRSP